MKAVITTAAGRALILTEEEAAWLHWYMQNAPSEGESQPDHEMRQKFFDITMS